MRPMSEAQISDIRQADEERLDIPYLASIFGGNIPVREDTDGTLIPESALYRMTLKPVEALPPNNHVVKGVIHVEGHPQSLISRLQDLLVSTLVREMGF